MAGWLAIMIFGAGSAAGSKDIVGNLRMFFLSFFRHLDYAVGFSRQLVCGFKRKYMARHSFKCLLTLRWKICLFMSAT